LTWGRAIELATTQPVPLDRWLILGPGIVGSWHMGPYGTLATTLFYAMSFGVLAAGSLFLFRWTIGWARRSAAFWQVFATGVPLAIVIIDLFLVRLR
jgi:hypothetical protein